MFRAVIVALSLVIIVLIPGVAVPQHAAPSDSGYNPKVFGPSKEGQNAIPRIKVPAPLKVSLYAAEPLLANPVGFCFDEKGRCYIAEQYRIGFGSMDNRGRPWLADDLAARTVEDRMAYFKKYMKKTEFDNLTKEQDRIRLLWDSTGSGVADQSVIFADGFNKASAGGGASVLVRGNKLWYSDIPDLWLLDTSNTATKPTERKVLSTGYGVHTSFSGHDLHGLRMGPDGKLYFSLGDRGLNVTTQEGKKLVYPDEGSVLRCNPDGSELEIFARGLRNPQDLVFDKYGDLFTADNNADGGDPARFVYVVEGGNSGWCIGWQYRKNLGSWNSEKIHGLQSDAQPAYVVPPVHHVAVGPSGVAYHPGVAQLPEKYKDHFFVCDFRGSPGGSGIISFSLKQKGASFELVGEHHFCWDILATDCEFAPDGTFNVLDWVQGWSQTGKGRIYRVADPALAKDELVLNTKKIIGEGMAHRKADELAKLLGHADMRVRQEAQFRLVEMKDTATLTEVAGKGKEQLARIHAIWGLGQIAHQKADVLTSLLPLTSDRDAQVRAQAAKILGTAKIKGADVKLLALLKDAEPRVRFFAAQSLAKVGTAADAPAIFQMLRDNADKDAYLRHAGVMALIYLNDPKLIETAAQDVNVGVRMAALLVMRRLQSPEIARFLNDTEPRIVVEAARAINDAPVNAALPALAGQIQKRGLSDPFWYRVLNANFRVGKKENALALAQFAGRTEMSEGLRVEALQMLADWENPNPLDRVAGVHRPLEKRPREDAAEAVRLSLGGLFTGSDKVRGEAAKVAAKYGIREVGPVLFELASDKTKPASVRVDTLRALETLKDSRLSKAVDMAIADGDARVRAQGRRILVKQNPTAGIEAIKAALAKGDIGDKQGALAVLAELNRPEADTLLTAALQQLSDKAGRKDLPAEIYLDVLDAAAKRKDGTIKKLLADFEAQRSAKDHLAKYREAMVGGDAEKGRRIFYEKNEVSCLRCHKIKGNGGDVGPALDAAGKQTREYLLESIVEPNKQIAKGYETVVITLNSGKNVTGVLKSEDAKEVRLMTAEGTQIVVPKADIDERVRGRTAMPEDMTRHLTRAEIRDLVEFLASLKE